MSYSRLFAVSVALVLPSCVVPVESGSAEPVEEAAQPSKPVVVNGAPAHCVVDADCPSGGLDCVTYTCGGGFGDGTTDVPGCRQVDTQPGGACNSGVGVCAYSSLPHTAGGGPIRGFCLAPRGTCFTGEPSPESCSSDAECDDQNPCTKDTCLVGAQGGRCTHAPVADGATCEGPAADSVCRSGGCCSL